MGEHRFEVWQDGLMVAQTSSADRHQAASSALHYARVYAQDGPVEVFEGPKKRGRLFATTQPLRQGDSDG